MPVQAAGLSVDQNPATAGYYVLNWTNEDDKRFVLEESTDPGFTSTERWELSEVSAITQTGLGDGTYYYRIREVGGPWSQTLSVTVEHHPLGRAFLFFSLGLLLFAALGLTLIIGHNKTKGQPA